MIPPLLFVDRAKPALLNTGSALDTLAVVNMVGRLDGALDGISRAVPCAERTSLTFDRIDLEGDQLLTDAGRTSLIDYMLLVFVTEITQGG